MTDFGTLVAEVDALREALSEMVYEVTAHCPMRPDGSHRPIITASVLERARAAIRARKDLPND